ncbi:MAG: hypothetical protein AUI33_00260 [Ignavibacteria bacterium 13_1_40CM_2_61_4]|nr:MAG: hypothetical protein AUI33_00260 [Ignavibacteria bacterium 13_1_40CM_2_61_4]
MFAPRKESESESGPNGTQHAAQSPRAGRSGEIGTPTLRSAASARTAAARRGSGPGRISNDPPRKLLESGLPIKTRF